MLALLFYLLPLIYVFIKDGFNGQSVGKKILNLAVINLSDNSRCSIGKSSLRGLITTVMGIIPLGLLVEAIIVLVTYDGRRIADKCANTQVVKI